MALSLAQHMDGAAARHSRDGLSRLVTLETAILQSLLPRRHTWRDQARDARGRFVGVTEASCQVPKCFLHTRLVVQRRSGLDG